jgi:hypothetical protein
MSCLRHANYSLLLYLLDPVHEELELEAQVDQTEEANPEPEPEQGKPRCITSSSLNFILN